MSIQQGVNQILTQAIGASIARSSLRMKEITEENYKIGYDEGNLTHEERVNKVKNDFTRQFKDLTPKEREDLIHRAGSADTIDAEFSKVKSLSKKEEAAYLARVQGQAAGATEALKSAQKRLQTAHETYVQKKKTLEFYHSLPKGGSE